jgi:hypothetical protein
VCLCVCVCVSLSLPLCVRFVSAAAWLGFFFLCFFFGCGLFVSVFLEQISGSRNWVSGEHLVLLSV